MKTMNRDEHGYINAIGASKYWGVTTSKVNGQKLWIVNIHPKWSYKTLKFRASSSYKLSEVDAARIAAYFYEVQCNADSKQETAFIKSACGRWVFVADVENSVIQRQLFRGQKCGNDPVVEIFDLFAAMDSVDVETPEQRKQRAKENEELVALLDDLDKPTVYSERELIALVTDGILNNLFSTTGARLLIGALEQAV